VHERATMVLIQLDLEGRGGRAPGFPHVPLCRVFLPQSLVTHSQRRVGDLYLAGPYTTEGSRPRKGVDRRMTVAQIWTLNVETVPNVDLSGFKVEALDGSIGKVDEAMYEAGGSFVVVDTGPWIFGKKVMLPAGVIRDIDLDTETVFVNRTKDQIKNAPQFEEKRYLDQDYRNKIGGYYDRGGAGYSER
jgi:hypothetical protein